MRYCYESCAPGWVIKVAVPVPDTVVATALTPSIPEYKILIQFMIKHRTLHCNLSVRSHIFALNVDGLTDYDDDRGGIPPRPEPVPPPEGGSALSTSCQTRNLTQISSQKRESLPRKQSSEYVPDCGTSQTEALPLTDSPWTRLESNRTVTSFGLRRVREISTQQLFQLYQLHHTTQFNDNSVKKSQLFFLLAPTHHNGSRRPRHKSPSRREFRFALRWKLSGISSRSRTPLQALQDS